MTRKVISSDEAQPADVQHSRPCGDCPWRRDAAAGWLGSMSAAEWIAAAHSDAQVECHTLLTKQCAGVSTYRANVCKLPRDPGVLRLPADRKAVFASPAEFRKHHEAP